MRIKWPINCFSLIIIVFIALLQASGLHADGWERTEDVATFEEVDWDQVQGDFNGLTFSAMIPSYETEYSWDDGEYSYGEETHIHGKVESETHEYDYYYYIDTTLSSTIAPVKQETFLKVMQFIKPEFTANVVDPKAYGARYVVDLTPNSDEHIFSCGYFYKRYLYTKDRLITLRTDDENSARRANFFESIKIN